MNGDCNYLSSGSNECPPRNSDQPGLSSPSFLSTSTAGPTLRTSATSNTLSISAVTTAAVVGTGLANIVVIDGALAGIIAMVGVTGLGEGLA